MRKRKGRTALIIVTVLLFLLAAAGALFLLNNWRIELTGRPQASLSSLFVGFLFLSVRFDDRLFGLLRAFGLLGQHGVVLLRRVAASQLSLLCKLNAGIDKTIADLHRVLRLQQLPDQIRFVRKQLEILS